MEIKDKPSSMSVREWITKKIATEIMIPENVIRQVIAHQFDSGLEALEKHNSIEISGFGKLFYNTKKAALEKQKLLFYKASYEAALNDSATTEKERRTLERKLDSAQNAINQLVKKEKASKDE